MSKPIRAFTMPKWGIEMAEGVVAEWSIAPGSAVKEGDVICSIDSDKISNEVEAEFASVLRRIIAQPGDTHPVGALLAVFASADVSDADIDAFIAGFKPADASFDGAGAAPSPAAQPPATAPAAAPVAAPAPKPEPEITLPEGLAISPKARELALSGAVDVSGLSGSGRKGRITAQDVAIASRSGSGGTLRGPIGGGVQAVETHYASPMARRLARDNGIDLGKLSGTGPRGRISKDDVLALIPAAAPPTAAVSFSGDNPPDVRKLSPMRKAIARRVQEAKSTIPHYYLRIEPLIDALLALRREINSGLDRKVSVTDLLVKACAKALVQVPGVNVQVHGDAVHHFAHADVAVAVATDNGLFTPVVRLADQKSVVAISAEIADFAVRARAGTLTPDDYAGGTFSLSNLGMFGVSSFDAVINPPQGAILAVGASERRPVEQDFALMFATVLPVTLSCDHRAIDGAMGGQFLSALKALLENPQQILV